MPSSNLIIPGQSPGAVPGRRRQDLLRPRFAKNGDLHIHPNATIDEANKTPLDLRTGKQFMPRVILLFARRGQGKTLWMTNMLYIMKERHRRAGTDFKVFTNYWTSFSDKVDPYLLDEMAKFPSWAHHALIGLDEIADLLPSARAMSNHSLLSAGFLRQIRKRSCEIIAATQFPQEITRALLRQVDFFVETEIIADGRAIRSHWHDWHGQITGNLTKKRWWPPDRDSKDWSFTLTGTDGMFGHYDTGEVVPSVYSAARDDIIAQQYNAGGAPVEQTERKITFEQMLDIVRDKHAVILLEDTLALARDSLDNPDLTAERLTDLLRSKGLLVGEDEDGDTVVYAEGALI